MSEQISPNANGNERDYGPFSSSGRDDISPDMKTVLEEVEKMTFPPNNDSVDTNKEKPEQPQDSVPSDEQIKH